MSTYYVSSMRKHQERLHMWDCQEQEKMSLWRKSLAGRWPLGKEAILGKESSSVESRGDSWGSSGEIFCCFQDEPGCTRVMEHQIPTGASKPVRLPPYRVSHAHRHALKPELEEMLMRGIIEPSTVEWSFLIVLVGKDGTMRLCGQQETEWANNNWCIPNNWSIPNDKSEWHHWQGRGSQLLLNQGILAGSSCCGWLTKDKFLNTFWIYQFTIMLFGLKGAQATFQQRMDCVIIGLDSFVSAYIDDMIIISDTFEEHLEHLQQVLERLLGPRVTAKSQKCHLGSDNCWEMWLGEVWCDLNNQNRCSERISHSHDYM